MHLASKSCKVPSRHVLELFQKFCDKETIVFDLTPTENLFWVIPFNVTIKNAYTGKKGMSENHLHNCNW